MDSLGGYRLVRRLGIGSRSDVWLGSDGSEMAAIKVFHDGAPRDRIDNEIEALGRASSRHLLRLEDLAMGADGVPCLILQRLSQWNLGRLLASARPSDGETVTILAPICLALAELHRVGIAHGRVRGSSILFDGTGAPVLASFGDAELFGTMPEETTGTSVAPALLIQQSSVAADIEALAVMCFSTVDPSSEVARWLSSSRNRDLTWFAKELAERLFQSARALPVSFANPRGESTSTLIPPRVAAHDRPTRGELESIPQPAIATSHETSGLHPLVTNFAQFLHLPDGMVSRLCESLDRVLERGAVASLKQRITKLLGPVRKPVWVIAGLVAVGVVVTATVLPLSRSSDAAQPRLQTPAPTPENITSQVSTAITGDDPLAAASALLDARDDCYIARSILCFDLVDQQGSAAMDSDSTQVRLLQDGGAADGSRVVTSRLGQELSAARHIAVVERLGDSVLLTVSGDNGDADVNDAKLNDAKPNDAGSSDAGSSDAGSSVAQGETFSLLIIKGEKGWRIRDLVPLTDSTY